MLLTTILAAFLPIQGAELLVDAETRQLTGARSPEARQLFAVGTRVVFRSEDPSAGREWFSWDAATDTRTLLADLAPGSRSSHVTPIGVVGGELYFFYWPGYFRRDYVRELWRTDGTPVGTRVVSGVRGLLAARVQSDRVVVWEETGANAMRQIWSVQGPTVRKLHDTTVAVHSVVSTAGGVFYIETATDRLYYRRPNGQPRHVFKNLNAKARLIGSHGQQLFLFVDLPGSGWEPTRVIDPILAEPIVMRVDFTPGAASTHDLGNRGRIPLGATLLHFASQVTTGKPPLVLMDGAGNAVRTFPHGSTSAFAGKVGKHAFFVVSEPPFDMPELWRTDGTVRGTSRVRAWNIGPIGQGVSVGSKLYFVAESLTSNGIRRDLACVDGNTLRTSVLSGPSVLSSRDRSQPWVAAAAGRVAISAPMDREGFAYFDTTRQTFSQVRYPRYVVEAGSAPLDQFVARDAFFELDGLVHFRTQHATARKTWVTGGTSATTRQLATEPYPTRPSLRDARILAATAKRPDRVLGATYGSSIGIEPAVFDGRSYTVLADLNPGAASSRPRDWTRAVDAVFFVGETGSRTLIFGVRDRSRSIVNVSSVFDRLANGATKAPMLHAACGNRAVVSFTMPAGNKTFGVVHLDDNGRASATRISGLPAGVEPECAFAHGNTLFLATVGQGLFALPCTGSVAQKIADVRVQLARNHWLDEREIPDSYLAHASWDRAVPGARLGAHIVFAGSTPNAGIEPWISDGTALGTRMVVDLERGRASSLPESPMMCASYGGAFVATRRHGIMRVTTPRFVNQWIPDVGDTYIRATTDGIVASVFKQNRESVTWIGAGTTRLQVQRALDQEACWGLAADGELVLHARADLPAPHTTTLSVSSGLNPARRELATLRNPSRHFFRHRGRLYFFAEAVSATANRGAEPHSLPVGAIAWPEGRGYAASEPGTDPVLRCATPRIGIGFRCHGQRSPSGSALIVLFGSPTRAPIPLGPGVFSRVDLRLPFFVLQAWPHIVDAWTVFYGLPNDRGLVGLTGMVQAFFLQPGHGVGVTPGVAVRIDG